MNGSWSSASPLYISFSFHIHTTQAGAVLGSVHPFSFHGTHLPWDPTHFSLAFQASWELPRPSPFHYSCYFYPSLFLTHAPQGSQLALTKTDLIHLSSDKSPPSMDSQLPLRWSTHLLLQLKVKYHSHPHQPVFFLHPLSPYTWILWDPLRASKLRSLQSPLPLPGAPWLSHTNKAGTLGKSLIFIIFSLMNDQINKESNE